MTAPLMPFTKRERLQHFWVRRRWLDLAVALLVVLAWAGASQWHWIPLALTQVPHDTRRVVYQVIVTVAATMGGFVVTSVSILVNLLRTPMTTIDRLLPPGDKRTVGSVFLSCLPRLLAVFAPGGTAMLTDANLDPGYSWMQVLVGGYRLQP